MFEDTQPIDVVSDEMLAAEEDEDQSTGEIAAADAAAAVVAGAGALPGEPPAQEPPVPSAAEAEAAAASLTLLQRGVDLLNVSRVPHKIAETNEQLGLPHVHVGFDAETVAVTFMWTMGWYRFHVDLESGAVTHARPRLPGTHACSPTAACAATGRWSSRRRRSAAPPPRARMRRPRRRPLTAQPPAAAPAGPTAEPETPREAAQKPPEFLSKSLLGQRSDDECVLGEDPGARLLLAPLSRPAGAAAPA